MKVLDSVAAGEAFSLSHGLRKERTPPGYHNPEVMDKFAKDRRAASKSGLSDQ